MKTLTNKLVTSVLALVLTGAALSIGVFAWFTVNNTATVDSFEANVQTGDGFYVSLDGTAWYSTITSAMIQDVVDNSSFTEFNALTSTDGTTLTDLDGDPASAGSYIEFNLYFVGSDAFTEIELSDLVLSSLGAQWMPGIAVPGTRSENDANIVINEFASNAARVSFENIYETAVVVVEQSAGTNDNTTGFGTFATNEAVLFYNAIMDEPISSGDFPSSPIATIEAGTTVSLGALVENNEPDPISPIVPTPAILNTIESTTGTYKKGGVTVRVWIEGWDEQSFNAILADTLSVSFTFTGLMQP